MLKNKLDGTPVVPVFVAEGEEKQIEAGKKELIYTPVSRNTSSFPTTSHVRSENGLAMIALFKYLLSLLF